jgi:hypothetical protein
MLYKAYRIFGGSHSSTTTAQSGFMVDALLEGMLLPDDVTIKDVRSLFDTPITLFYGRKHVVSGYGNNNKYATPQTITS